MDGYIPEDGKTAFDLIPGLEGEYMKRSLGKQGKKWLVPSYDPTIWGVTNTEDIAWMNRHLSSMPFDTHDQPIGILKPRKYKKTISHVLNTRIFILWLRKQNCK